MSDLENKYQGENPKQKNNNKNISDREVVKYTIKDSVFTNLFQDKKYLVQTYHDYFERTKQNLYKSKKVQMPKPELYVIYTGDRKSKPFEVSLSEEFFDGEECCIDVKVKMIYDGKEGDIINQYVVFTKVCSEQIAIYGRTKKAILEAIRICKDRNVLKEYLESKEKEVVDIMMVLYDEQEVMRSYVESEVYEARIEMATEMATDMLKNNEPLEKIMRYTKLSKEEIEKIAGLQLV